MQIELWPRYGVRTFVDDLAAIGGDREVLRKSCETKGGGVGWDNGKADQVSRVDVGSRQGPDREAAKPEGRQHGEDHGNGLLPELKRRRRNGFDRLWNRRLKRAFHGQSQISNVVEPLLRVLLQAPPHDLSKPGGGRVG